MATTILLRKKEWKVILKVHPHIAAFLNEGTIKTITKLKWKYWLFIEIEEDATLAIDEFKVYSKNKSVKLPKNLRNKEKLYEIFY